MADRTSKRRYVVSGNLAEDYMQPKRKEEKRKTTRVLPRHAIDTIPFIYVMVVAMACICILGSTVAYVHTKTAITQYTKQMVALQNELEGLKEDNNDLQNEIATSTDINTIRDKAKELGMRAAGKGEVIYYDQSESEYVRQKEDIPND